MNVYNIIMQNGYVLVLAIGMLLPILTGSIDLFVGSVVAVVSAFAGVMMYNWGNEFGSRLLFVLFPA